MITKEKIAKLLNNAILNWDYLGWKSHGGDLARNPYCQQDWNQTLITKINQISAMIHASKYPNEEQIQCCVLVSTKAMDIISTLEYYKPDKKTLSKYNVHEITDLEPNTIIVGKESSIFSIDNELLDSAVIHIHNIE